MTTESNWARHDIEGKVRTLLSTVTYYNNPDHHMGRPFATAYQLAIMFAQEYPDAFDAMGMPVGGAGTGAHTSLSQYLAGELSRRIGDGQMDDIEGGFLSDRHLRDLVFDNDGCGIRASVRQVSMFRLRA